MGDVQRAQPRRHHERCGLPDPPVRDRTRARPTASSRSAMDGSDTRAARPPAVRDPRSTLPAWCQNAPRQQEGREELRLNRSARSAIICMATHTTTRSKAVPRQLDAIEVDRLRVKPIVKVTGEFWAQTTEGDGNFHMFRFLEREGAQVMVEPIGDLGHVHAVPGEGDRTPSAAKAPTSSAERGTLDKRLGERAGSSAASSARSASASASRRTSTTAWSTRSAASPTSWSTSASWPRSAHPTTTRSPRGGEGHLEVAQEHLLHRPQECATWCSA